ncbi:hypothetical protein I7I50_06364 [Histoplasma capsulatum G186AR]|uniref:Uncharacterized protein n=1 Tax=Ajellomyces capsulatus TaxID=5037 RepID=A0A8H7Z2Q3_AJECA|nr:hypothetical protein I7I52_10563 [Histoplasma capsulatum]QSS67327.1 hypothetical protein I7I50_06364 [Histoplasma capsulatum G186AR]
MTRPCMYACYSCPLSQHRDLEGQAAARSADNHQPDLCTGNYSAEVQNSAMHSYPGLCLECLYSSSLCGPAASSHSMIISDNIHTEHTVRHKAADFVPSNLQPGKQCSCSLLEFFEKADEYSPYV